MRSREIVVIGIVVSLLIGYLTRVLPLGDDLMDSDSDGVPDKLEINGYYYENGEFRLWDGDPNITYYCTDPTQPSTDQDPYSDGMEVSGVKMDTSVAPPGNHPLVPAYPDIYVSMVGFDVASTSPITSSSGGIAQEAWSNVVTDENTMEHQWGVQLGWKGTIGTETTNEISVALTGGGKYGSKHSVTSSTSGFSSKDWKEATTVNPAEAGKIKLRVKFENRGTAAAQNIIPTVNILLGDKTINTYEMQEDKIIDTLAVNQKFPTTGEWVVGDKPHTLYGMQEIILTLDELKSIQLGVPIFLDIPQIDANVLAQNEEGHWEVVDTWQHYQARIDGVCARISVDLGDGKMKDYRVFARSANGPEVTLRKALEYTVGYEETSDGIKIMGAPVGDWRIGFSQNAFDDVGSQLAEKNILDVVLDAGWTITIKASTGLDIPQIIWCGGYQDKETTLVKAAVIDDYAVCEVLFKTSPEADGQEMESELGRTGVYYLELASDYQVTGNELIEAFNDRGNSITTPVEVPRKAPITDGVYVITSVYSNKVLDIEGSNVVQYNYAGIDNQKWNVQHLDHGYYRIMGKDSEICLEVVDGKTADGVNVQLNAWQNTANQRWALEAVDDGNFVIIASHSGKYLDIVDSSQDNRASVIQNTGSDSASQKWILQPVDSYPEIMPIKGTQEEHFIVSNKGSGTCLNVRGKSTDDAAEVVHNNWRDGDYQKWEFIPVGEGYFRIVAKHSGLCLTIENNSVIQKTYFGDNNQKWLIKRHEAVDSNPDDFYYSIENKESLMCLTSNQTDNKLNQLQYTGGDNQKWLLIPVDQVKIQIKITAVSFKLLDSYDKKEFLFGDDSSLEIMYIGLQYCVYNASDDSEIGPWIWIYGRDFTSESPYPYKKWYIDSQFEAESENTRKFTVDLINLEDIYIKVRARFGEDDFPFGDNKGGEDDWWWAKERKEGKDFFESNGLHSFEKDGADGKIRVTFRLELVSYKYKSW